MVYSFIMKKSGVNGKTWWENRWVSMDTRGQTCSTPLHNHDISILVHEHCHEKLQLTRAHLPNHISTHLRSGFRIFRCHAVNQETSRNTKTRKHNLQSDILPTYIIGKCWAKQKMGEAIWPLDLLWQLRGWSHLAQYHLKHTCHGRKTTASWVVFKVVGLILPPNKSSSSSWLHLRSL